MTTALTRREALTAGFGTVLLPATLSAQPAQKPAEFKIGVTTFLSGPASVFGVPSRKACEMLVEHINAAGGIAGVPVRPIFVDEGPGTDHLVGEFRRLVQSEGVQVMMSAISSGSCLACTPLATELKKVTILWDCGTQRIFEEAHYDYAFRTQGYGTSEILAPLLYLLKTKPNIRTVAVINQDYAWGRDSWELWKAGMDALKPGVRVVAEMFPRFGSTDFSTEITRLLALRPDVVLSTSWGGELVTLIRQSTERRLHERTTFVLPVAEASMQILGRTMPEGHVIGTRGDHWNNHPAPKDPALFNKFVGDYRQKFNEYPIYPCHHIAQALWALKAATEKAVAAKNGAWPSDAELAGAFRGLTFPTPTSTITLREDGQGLEDQIVGLSSFNDRFPFAVPKEMMLYPGAQVSAPVGQKSTDWLKSLKPDFVTTAGRSI
ncbi:ABC transporter substrate-binding protein [Neoroseomonas lacus]|uniref:ABC transporter substrate-binding protein n=1 Tax=Neoroseomonas lacus TaxID=287609 RepID=A0A917KFL8_9PROT|nr:ABC transporter substrate-binding protein [Neoroseomonas lacus]GGJ09393.1 ABC transporter substrate-binding protein [Neoroseomonas lacus]